ncbi:MAG: tRNA (adenosine(37)-N6)-dimethylallyltransferase MiaA [Alphaproteobacteria bacterium]
MEKKQVYVIAGPTASGKSKLALDLAENLGGEIINADAFQVYAGLQILTARPGQAEMRGIPHHLYGYMDNFSQEDVAGWAQKAAAVILKTKCPVVVGGTGLYLSVLMNGMSPMPDIPFEIREKVRTMPAPEVLAKLDKGEIPRDIQRQRRALEVLLSTGKPIEYFQNQPKKKFLEAEFKTILLLPPREKLYARIETRLVQMLGQNVLGEVQNLVNSKATGGVMKAIGVKELIDFIEKKCDLATAAEHILLATRHYAKRQRTWFKHQLAPETQVIEEPDLKDVITK